MNRTGPRMEICNTLKSSGTVKERHLQIAIICVCRVFHDPFSAQKMCLSSRHHSRLGERFRLHLAQCWAHQTCRLMQRGWISPDHLMEGMLLLAVLQMSLQSKVNPLVVWLPSFFWTGSGNIQWESETPMPGVTDAVGYHNAYPQTAVLPFSFRITSSQSMRIIYASYCDHWHGSSLSLHYHPVLTLCNWWGVKIQDLTDRFLCTEAVCSGC